MPSKRILIVEDHASNMKLLQELLKSRGYETRGVADGMAVRGATQEFRPDLILMDLQIPGIDGFEATRQLKADPATAGIPVVAVTAFALQEEEKRARANGFVDYFTKPLEIPGFLSALDRLMA
jgi:two-component system cell cycle response regulator DivK